MKTSKPLIRVLIPLAALLSASACSTFKKETAKSESNLSQSGPNVINARTNPSVIELNNQWQATGPAEVLAEVKDFTSEVQDVKLRFLRAPLEIPMQKVNGTTWRAQLTPEQLKTLAVGGETMKYEANIVARNADGQIAVSPDTVNVAISAPAVEDQQKKS
jgi:hypothetical protein